MPTLSQQFDFVLGLSANWDGYGADPISPYAVALARILATTIRNTTLELLDLRVYPTRPGGVQLEWETPIEEHELEINADGTLEILSITKSTGESRTTRYDLARGLVAGAKVGDWNLELHQLLAA
jgi:hypothetical protein